MRRSLLIICCLLSANLQAQTMTPIEFNNWMADISDSLFYKGQNWGGRLGDLHESGDYQQLKSSRENIQTFIDASIAQVKSAPEVGEGSNVLANAMLNYLYYERKLVKEAFMPFESLTLESTDEDFKKVVDNLTMLAEDEGFELAKLNNAQNAYAAKNGFSIEPVKEEEVK